MKETVIYQRSLVIYDIIIKSGMISQIWGHGLQYPHEKTEAEVQSILPRCRSVGQNVDIWGAQIVHWAAKITPKNKMYEYS